MEHTRGQIGTSEALLHVANLIMWYHMSMKCSSLENYVSLSPLHYINTSVISIEPHFEAPIVRSYNPCSFRGVAVM